MESVAFLKTNRLIRRGVIRAFPACFAATLAGSVILMVDSLLAGALISQLAIAAVAIGNPIPAVFRALTQSISNGAAVQLTISVGRGSKEESSRAHSLGLIGSFLLGLFFTVIAFAAADLLVLPFGGAGNREAAVQAAIYLRSSAFMILGSSLNIYFGKLLALYGYQTESFLNSFAGMIANIVSSIVFVNILPENLAIAGLGIGTCIGSYLSVTVNFLLLRIKRIPLRFRPYRFTISEIANVLKLGFPSASNNLIDGLISGVINNIILAGFGGDTAPLSVYTAVKSIFGFASAPALSTTLSVAPLFGLLYGARDKNGIRRTLGEGFRVGIVFSAVWCTILIVLLPVLMKFFGMPGSSVVRTGVYVTFLFIPVILAIRLMTTLFESTEKPGMGLLYSIVPDSIIYPLMLAALLPLMNYTGIWIAYGGNGVIFLLLLYLIRSAKNKTSRMSIDRLLCLDESVRDNVPMLDYSIHASSDTASDFSAKVQTFLTQSHASARTSYMTALCLEELIADFSEHTKIRENGKEKGSEKNKEKSKALMDIKLFSDENSFRIIVRNAAKPYNPLDSNPDDPSKMGVRMVQQVAQKIEYSYLYKMNIITIDLAK